MRIRPDAKKSFSKHRSVIKINFLRCGGWLQINVFYKAHCWNRCMIGELIEIEYYLRQRHPRMYLDVMYYPGIVI